MNQVREAAPSAKPRKPASSAPAEPLVSILVPAYKERFLAEALRSALAQSYPRFEVIVCNDNPGSGVARLVEAFDDDRISYFEHVANVGSIENYKKCFELANGDYVKFLNDDDLLDADCVRTMVACMEVYGREVSLVTSRRLRIDEAGRPIQDDASTTPFVEQDARIHGLDLGNFVLRHLVNVIGEPTTALFRRADLAPNEPDIFSLNGHPYEMNIDVAMWLALLLQGDCIYLARPLSCLRRHAAQESFSPATQFSLVETWSRLRHDAIALGYLADAQSRLQAAENARALLSERLRVGRYTQEETRRLEAQLGVAKEELARAGGAGESTPSAREEIHQLRKTGDWRPPVRYAPLPGAISIKPRGLRGFVQAWQAERRNRRRRRKRVRRREEA